MNLEEQRRQAISAAPHGGWVLTLGPKCEWKVDSVAQQKDVALAWFERQRVPARIWLVASKQAHLMYSR